MNTCGGLRQFPWRPLILVMQCLLILELTPSLRAHGSEDPNRFDYSIANGTITITRYTGTGGDVTIPSIIDDLPVTSIGPQAFYLGRIVTSVAIPNSVTSIGEEAFRASRSLTSLTIPDSVTSIGKRAFANCISLTSVTIGRGVTSIGEGAFSSCSGLTNVTIPDSVTSIGGWTFYGSTSLTNVMVGSGVTTIGYAAFHSCTDLTSVYFRGSPPELIDSWVFSGADNAIVYYLAGTEGWGSTFGGRPTAIWTLPPTILTRPGVTPNAFTFTVSWASQEPIVVEAVNHLGPANWVTLYSGPVTGGSIEIADTQWKEHRARFYRVRVP